MSSFIFGPKLSVLVREAAREQEEFEASYPHKYDYWQRRTAICQRVTQKLGREDKRIEKEFDAWHALTASQKQ